MGAGEISPLRMLSPSLMFDTTTSTSNYGYKKRVVRKVSDAARFVSSRRASTTVHLRVAAS
ncbi:CO(2)-response secreted protease-like [Panicum miliaceum]|uniref:CO(2)-response secreted protease-like n=1 Tax=Panicum miliaceum TaxID=4540 RepID=A0A3L6SHD3_PANMI|nr:CO(2)-response secreted protease-like [Panicum miliaceum]